MAMETPCQTPGSQFHTYVHDNIVEITVNLPMDLNLTEEEAELLEANMHNAMELVLARYFVKGV